MKKESIHSQDYDPKHGSEYNVKDKAVLREEFINNKRKDAAKKDRHEHNHIHEGRR